jgi:RNA polymerase sigma factor (sigma-70 family)
MFSPILQHSISNGWRTFLEDMGEHSVEEIAGQCLEQLMDEYQDSTLAYAMKLTGGHEANAWDLVQETFKSVYLYLRSHPDTTIECPQHLLNKSLRRRFLNSVRGKRNRSTDSLEALGLTGASEETSPITFPARSEDEPENAIELHEKKHKISRFLQQRIEAMSLDQEVKRDMQLHLLGGYSFQEIAYAYKVPVGSVQHRINRGIDLLGTQLGHLKSLEEFCE